MRWVLYPLAVIFSLALVALAGVAALTAFSWPNLPSVDILTDYHPKIPLRIFTADGHLLAEYGEERRSFVPIDQIPAVMKNAVLAAEDERFYEHPGVDAIGIARAALANLTSGGKQQGASTITMQVARNFFLTREKSFSRKFYEILLSIKIERNLTKDQILEIYINQIYLGQRSYGFATAARTYFDKSVKDLSIGEAAMLAGLPKAPSAYNPIVNPKRAALRQAYVLRRMRELGFITESEFREATENPVRAVSARSSPNRINVHGEYVAEMARRIAVEQFKDAAYEMGIRITTTISSEDQEAAYQALRKGVLDYDRRHGYRGPESFADMKDIRSDQDEALDDILADVPDYDDLLAAVVLQVEPKKVTAYRRGTTIEIEGAGLRFAAPMLSDRAPAGKRVRRGAVIRIRNTGKGWEILQLPQVQAALVATDPHSGAIKALVGGFDFGLSKFNHVTQGWRQPGSSFKPFIYSAALEKGYSPASWVDDSPLSFSSGVTGSQAWEPKNYDGRYDGPMTIRDALARSKNMVSIRLLQSIGPEYAQDYITRFGFERDRHPPYLTMALGAGSATVWEMASAYSVFANGGFKVEPYIVKEMVDGDGRVLARVDPPLASESAARVIDPRNAYLMDSMLRDVVRRGTGARARSLGRNDLAGKTGTTNDYVDAWFCGYSPRLVAISWVGFDQPQNLGRGETGGAAALPIWIDFMRSALKDVPETRLEQPPGLIRIQTEDGNSNELMYQENLPPVPPEPTIDPDALPPPSEEPFSYGPGFFPSPPTPSPAPAPVAPAPQRNPAPVYDLAPRPIKRN